MIIHWNRTRRLRPTANGSFFDRTCSGRSRSMLWRSLRPSRSRCSVMQMVRRKSFFGFTFRPHRYWYVGLLIILLLSPLFAQGKEDARPVVDDSKTTPAQVRDTTLPTLWIVGDSTLN